MGVRIKYSPIDNDNDRIIIDFKLAPLKNRTVLINVHSKIN